MKFALALALALSGGAARAQDGGAPAVVDVEFAEVRQPDGGVVLVSGGAWLSDYTLITAAQREQRLDAENKALRAAPPPPSPPALVALIVLTAAAGYVGGLLTPRP